MCPLGKPRYSLGFSFTTSKRRHVSLFFLPNVYLGRQNLVQQGTLLGMLQSHGLSRGQAVEVQPGKLLQSILHLCDLWPLVRVL